MLDTIGQSLRSLLAWAWPGRKISEVPGEIFSRYGMESTAGVLVNEDEALSLSAVFAAVNLLSRVIGSLPLKVYRRFGRDKEEAITHPAYRLLHSAPNPEMTSATFRRTMEWHRLINGNAYAEVVWAGNGKPVGLWPIEADRVRPKRHEDGTLYYEVDQSREVSVGDMIHVPLVSTDGVCGQSFLAWATESLGLGIATQTHAGAWFGNGARPGTILEHPANLTKEQRAEFKKGWIDKHGTAAKSGGVAVLYGGWKWVGTDGAIDPEKSQLIEQRRFTTEEVARWLGIPPHLLRDLSRATFSNIEQQNLDFLVYSLGPILVDYEQEFDRKLLSPPGCYSKHNLAGLLRGDSAARSAFYREMIQIGVMSVNEAREYEDWNPVDGGDVHFFPLNMAPLFQVAGQNQGPRPSPTPDDPEPVPAPPVEEPAPAPGESSEQSPALQTLLTDTLARLQRVEVNALRRASEKPGRFLDWLEGYYPAHESRLSSALSSVLVACAVPDSSLEVAQSWCARSKEEMLSLAGNHTARTFAGAIDSALSKWDERPEQTAKALLEKRP